MKQFGKCLKSRRGMTMVEVLMGFVVLVVFLGGLSSVIAFSSNMLYESMDLKKTQEALREQLYKKTVDFTTGPAGGFNRTFQKEEGCRLVMEYKSSGGEQKSIPLSGGTSIYRIEYEMESGDGNTAVTVYGFE